MRAWLMAAALACACPHANAGLVFGPYLFWINLTGDESVTSAMRDYLHQDVHIDTCWNSHALLIASDFPKGLTPGLVRKAVVARDPAARRRLVALLNRGDEEIDAFDGVVVAVRLRVPTMLSIDAHGKIRSQAAAIESNQPDWPDAFCGVMPPIYRKP